MVFYLCSRVGFVPSILLAVPTLSRRHGFWAQRPPTGFCVWSKLLTLLPSPPLLCFLHLAGWAPRVPEVHPVLSMLPDSATRSWKLMRCPCGRSLSYVALVLCELIALNELTSFYYCEVAGLSVASPWLMFIVVRLFPSLVRAGPRTCSCCVLTRCVCHACRVAPGWSRSYGIRAGCFTGMTQPSNEPVYGSSYENWRTHRALVRYVRVFPTLGHLRCRIGVGGRVGGGRVVLPTSVRCAVRAGFVMSCRVFSDGWTARWAASSTLSGVVDG